MGFLAICRHGRKLLEAEPHESDIIFGPKFNALRCAIYHVARRNYLDLLNRILNFVVIVLGASVAGKAAKLIHLEDEAWLEFSVLIVATAQLTFDFGYRARTHEIRRRSTTRCWRRSSLTRVLTKSGTTRSSIRSPETSRCPFGRSMHSPTMQHSMRRQVIQK